MVRHLSYEEDMELSERHREILAQYDGPISNYNPPNNDWSPSARILLIRGNMLARESRR